MLYSSRLVPMSTIQHRTLTQLHVGTQMRRNISRTCATEHGLHAIALDKSWAIVLDTTYSCMQ